MLFTAATTLRPSIVTTVLLVRVKIPAARAAAFVPLKAKLLAVIVPVINDPPV